MPSLCEFYPGIFLTTEEKSRKNLSQGKTNLSQSTVYTLPKHPHITKPTNIHTRARARAHILKNPHMHTRPHITKQRHITKQYRYSVTSKSHRVSEVSGLISLVAG